MPKVNFQKIVEQLMSLADVQINGDRSWDLQVRNKKFYARVLTFGSLGLGESYMDSWCDSERLDDFFHKILSAELGSKIEQWTEIADFIRAKLFNLQKQSRAFQVGQHHYDIGNDLYELMLDRRLIYSCGYWKNAMTLDEAQEAKLDLTCRKLDIKSGMRVLDIGCGWGGAARFIAEHYQAEVTGITVSREQAQYGQDLCRGLPVEIRLQDYRKLNEKFDRVLSIGMFEHVGYKNYHTFMDVVRKNLKNHGLFLLQTIGRNRSANYIDPWINKYIFPNAMLPSLKQITEAIEGKLVLEDLHNFGADYDKTLIHWFQNCENNWEKFNLNKKYGERFYRMWKYYLLACAGSFRARINQLWQIVLSPNGTPGGYSALR